MWHWGRYPALRLTDHICSMGAESGKLVYITVGLPPARVVRSGPHNLPSGRFLLAAAMGSPDDGQDLGDGFQADDEGDTPGMQHPGGTQTQRRPRLATEEENRRLHQQWDASLEDNVVRNTCRQAQRSQRSVTLAKRLRGDFLSTARALLKTCPSCGCVHGEQEPSTLELVESIDANHIIYAATEGRIKIPVQAFRCTQCGAEEHVHRITAGAFPATPKQPRVCYAIGLLALTHAVHTAAPMPMAAWCGALQQIHIRNGCAEGEISGEHSVWRHLSMAADQWWRVERATEERFAVEPISTSMVAEDAATAGGRRAHQEQPGTSTAGAAHQQGGAAAEGPAQEAAAGATQLGTAADTAAAALITLG